MSTSPRFLLAGGGTGGHIFPLLAIAESLCRLAPGAQCRFVCSTRPLDADILTREGATFEPIPARPFGMRPGTLARFAMGWGSAVRAARQLLRAYEPSGVITSGGFVAAPVVHAARTEQVPVVAVNLDAVAGKANRWIGRHAARCLSTTDGASDRVPAHWDRIAPIVRQAMRSPKDPAEARRALGLDPQLRTLLVTGGSQGAESVNGAIAFVAQMQPPAFSCWQVLHQCGGHKKSEGFLRKAYAAAEVPATITPFIDDMASAWAAADLAISRAGTGAVAEVRASCTPALFLPYPFHRDDHQRVNALVCERAGGAKIIPDGPDRTGADLLQPLVDLLINDAARAAMRDNLAALGPCDGADAIARAALDCAAKP